MQQNVIPFAKPNNTLTQVSEFLAFVFDDTHELRALHINGEPWFVASDVCAVLAIGNVSLAVNGRPDRENDGVDSDDRGIASVNTPSGAQQMLVVNESGLYALIFKSRKPEAKRFKKWITSEVLPSLRKTGSYQMESVQPPVALPDFTNPAIAARAWAEQFEAKAQAQEQLAIAAPKAQALDRIAQADGEMCITNAAKTIGMPPRKLIAWMERHDWIYRRPGSKRHTAYQARIKAGYLTHKVTTVERADGSEKVVESVIVTPKGLAKLAEVAQA